MSLSTRLSAFFLTALALVLGGFSLTLYLLARSYLHRQTDERLAAALDTLTAATELEKDGLDWDPEEHPVALGQGSWADEVRWTVHDEQGRLVDRSANLDLAALASEWPAPDISGDISFLATREGQPWHFVQRRVSVPPSLLQSPSPRPPGLHTALVLTAGVSLAPQEQMLSNLALATTGLSVGVWLLAALAGRWLARRALAPVRSMATTARTMGAADLGQRLPSPGTADELEELGRAFNGLLSRLEEAFERQRRFTGDASHQLRTPLAALLGQVEVVLRRDRSAEEYRDALDRVRSQGLHLHQIVNMLLFLSRADAEARPLDLEPLDLAVWLAAHLERWSGHPRADDLHFENLAAGPVWVRVQAPLLGQLVDNLLDNACKYSRPGTPVRVRLGAEPVLATVEVADEGCGIGAQDLPQVFEPFYRSDEARRLGHAGVGLGLAVAERIASALGGTLTVSSEVGRGSRFRVALPREKPASTGAIRQADDPEALGSGCSAEARDPSQKQSVHGSLDL
jgi:heavy metal sensor kinase